MRWWCSNGDRSVEYIIGTVLAFLLFAGLPLLIIWSYISSYLDKIYDKDNSKLNTKLENQNNDFHNTESEWRYLQTELDNQKNILVYLKNNEDRIISEKCMIDRKLIKEENLYNDIASKALIKEIARSTQESTTPQHMNIVEIESGASGRIFKIEVKVGDLIKAGDSVVILDSMNMEIPIVTPKDGTIVSIDCVVGDQVEAGASLATLSFLQK